MMRPSSTSAHVAMLKTFVLHRWKNSFVIKQQKLSVGDGSCDNALEEHIELTHSLQQALLRVLCGC